MMSQSGRPAAPESREFLDPANLRRELDRVNDICAGCRRCLPLCPSFPALFAAIDARDGECGAVPDVELRDVVDLCYQCKLCYPHCPYTPDDGHRFNIDFPRLMLRSKLVRARHEGVTLQDRCLGNPDRLGRIGCRTTPVSNLVNRSGPLRWIMEKVVGIHRERMLPPFHGTTFQSWWRKRAGRSVGRATIAGGDDAGRRVALFPTCFVNWNAPDTGKAAVAVLEHNGCAVSCPTVRCCGMPLLDGGDLVGFKRNAAANLAALAPAVAAGADVVTPGPTCSYVFKREYPDLYGGKDAALVAERVYDLGEYLFGLKQANELDTSFTGKVPRKIAYHLPCHLKVQNIGFRSRDLLELLPDATVTMLDRCARMDGTWGMKKQHYGLSKRLAEPLMRELRETGADVVATDCPLAGIQIAECTGTRPVHPVVLLRDAYGLDRR